MKNIFLQKLTITNFKGIKLLDIPFGHESFIYGANGTGKTTISDAFMWLMFGKNTEERKDFSIKPHDASGNASQKLENEVIGYFVVDGKAETLKRVQREKWVKSRGEVEPTFQGNETLFFWNDVPCQAGEYQKKVSELIDERLFKLITSPFAFAGLNWTEKRSIITGIAGEVNDTDIAASRDDFRELLRELSGKSLEDFKKEVAAKKKKLRDELALIPARIDELRRSMPEKPDAGLIDIDIVNLENKIQACNDRIKDASKASEQFYAEKSKRNSRIGEINSQLFNLVEIEKRSIRAQYSDKAIQKQNLENEIRQISREIESVEREKNQLVSRVDFLEQDIKSLTEQWYKVDAETLTFNDSEFTCPTCNRPYDVSDIEAKQAELTANFNRKKADRLFTINASGKAKKLEKTTIQGKIDELEQSLQMQNEILSGKQTELKGIYPLPEEYDITIQANKNALENSEYKALSDELDRLKQVNDLPFEPSKNTDAIEVERRQYEQQRDALKLKLKDQEVIDRTNARIDELSVQSKDFAQQIATLEKAIFTAESFEKAKIDLVEERVNKLFTGLRFRMFKQNINGSMEPTCEILINGVPFSDANTASQINAGVEIINILCKSYSVSAPIFIDNRESCTNIIPTESQIINLVVSPEHKVLTVK